jgi:hypothetical protein
MMLGIGWDSSYDLFDGLGIVLFVGLAYVPRLFIGSVVTVCLLLFLGCLFFGILYERLLHKCIYSGLSHRMSV